MILITGADGQLGKEFRAVVGDNDLFICAGRDEFDLTDQTQMEKYIDKHNIKMVINCAAYTNTKIETAKEKLINYQVNALGVAHLGLITGQRGINVIHISTNYVFESWELEACETNIPNATSEYGKAKMIGENLLIGLNGSATIVRVSNLVSHHSENIITRICDMILHLENLKVSDGFIRLTHTKDVVKFILSNMFYFDTEVAHVNCNTYCSVKDLFIYIVNKMNKQRNIILDTDNKIQSPVLTTLPEYDYSLNNCDFSWQNVVDRVWRANEN